MNQYYRLSFATMGVITLFAACSHIQVETPVPTPEVVADTLKPAPVVLSIPTPPARKEWKTTVLVLPNAPSSTMIQAQKYFAQYGNSDEFYEFAKAHFKPLAGGNATDITASIKSFRECLDKGEKIDIKWKRYAPFSAALGGWDGLGINQNPKKTLNAIGRSAHWLHEVSHYCNFTHISNSIAKYPVIESSFPYQIGYRFEEFLTMKTTSKLAGTK